MLREVFVGRRVSHFHINPLVQAFILSEIFIWSPYSAVLPIFAIFITKDIPGGRVETAAIAYSVYLISRVICELISGKVFARSSDTKKIIGTIVGILILGASYMGFAVADSLLLVFVFYAVSGVGLGIASPPKSALFSMHLDKNKETSEWGLYDAMVFTGMALATALGGFVAGTYGFRVLFIAAAILIWVAVIPYLLYLYPKKGS